VLRWPLTKGPFPRGLLYSLRGESPREKRGAQQAHDSLVNGHHAFALIGTALSKTNSVFQSSSLKVVLISPNAS
jgi:hypothetical protein